jgi:hypothetical protein
MLVDDVEVKTLLIYHKTGNLADFKTFLVWFPKPDFILEASSIRYSKLASVETLSFAPHFIQKFALSFFGSAVSTIDHRSLSNRVSAF